MAIEEIGIGRQLDLLPRPGCSLRGVGMFPIRSLAKRRCPGPGTRETTKDRCQIPIRIAGRNSIRMDD